MIPNCQHSESIAKIAAALAKALPMIDSAKKDANNPAFRSKYADLTSVVDAYKEHLAAVGIAVMQPPSSRDGEAVVTTILLHDSGEWIASELALKPVKGDPQGIGSAITYARRYGAQGMLGITAEDDDGNAASGTGSKPAAQEVADRKIAQLQRNQATPKPAGAVTEDPLKSYLRRAGQSPKELKAVYAELCEGLRQIGGNDLADQCWSQAIEDVQDQAAEFNVIVTRLYRALKSNQAA